MFCVKDERTHRAVTLLHSQLSGKSFLILVGAEFPAAGESGLSVFTGAMGAIGPMFGMPPGTIPPIMGRPPANPPLNPPPIGNIQCGGANVGLGSVKLSK